MLALLVAAGITAGGTPPPAGAAARAGTQFYVDPAAAGTNSGGSWANAWTSFGAVKWSSLKPGDALNISGGATSQKYAAPSFTVGASGITIRAATDAGHNGTVIFDYSSLGSSASTIGISLGSADGVTVAGAGRWQITNLVNTNSGSSSVGIAGTSGNTGVTVDRMTFVNDNNPVRFTSTSGITISNNAFRQIRGDAVIAMAGSKGGFGSSRIFGNTIEPVCQLRNGGACPGPDGIQVGSGVSIYNNHFKETTTTAATSGQHPDQIQAQGDNLKIYGNTFTNVGDSDIDFDTFADARPHDVYVYDNVFQIVDAIDPYPEYFRLYRSSGVALQSITNFKIVNNDFIDNTGTYRVVRFDMFGGNPTASGNEIRNNIFYNSGDGTANGPAIYIDASSAFTASSWAIDYNVYSRPRGAPHIHFGARDYGAASWVASHEPHGRVAAPSFTSYQPHSLVNDYHLRGTDTVARDAGLSESSLFTTDFDGVARPQGAAWDIGAFEQRAGNPTPPPATGGVGKTVPLARRSKSSGCRLGSSPDRRCSPGAYFDKLTTTRLCSASFHASALPAVAAAVRTQVERSYGLTTKQIGASLVIDRIVPLGLGGSNDIANLFPERANAHPGYRVKDKLERRLHTMVCAGRIALRSAQTQIAANWQALYEKLYGVRPR